MTRIIQGLFFFIIILICIVSSTKDNDRVSSLTNYTNQSFFIIDYDVKMYSSDESFDEIAHLKYFDSFIRLSSDTAKNGRMKIKLLNGAEGWVEEKYTSIISKDWVKLFFDNNHFCYVFPGLKLSLDKQQDQGYSSYTYRNNNEYYINMSIVYVNNYQEHFKGNNYKINIQIQGGDDKNLNWNKEFIYDQYKINYVITTFDPEGMVNETFDLVKLNEIEQKKYYTFGIHYDRTDPLEKRLIQRKALFSTLQNLR